MGNMTTVTKMPEFELKRHQIKIKDGKTILKIGKTIRIVLREEGTTHVGFTYSWNIFSAALCGAFPIGTPFGIGMYLWAFVEVKAFEERLTNVGWLVNGKLLVTDPDSLLFLASVPSNAVHLLPSWVESNQARPHQYLV